MASQAGKCFKDRSVKEKRRLLNLVLSNSTWGNGELTVEFRQPFDTIALGVTQCATEMAPPLGLEEVALSDGEMALSDSGDAESDVTDARNAQIRWLAIRWDSLPEGIRVEILRLAEEASIEG